MHNQAKSVDTTIGDYTEASIGNQNIQLLNIKVYGGY